jgi:hypothetical protein
MKQATRVPVPITAEERAEIEAGMKVAGIRAMADFLRVAGLEKARKAKSEGA